MGSKIIIVAGFGPGISSAVARRFGREGFTVALVARNAARLTAGVAELAAAGINAEAFPADLSHADSIAGLVGSIRAKLGPITAIHWNVYGAGAGDVTTAPLAELQQQVAMATVSLTAMVQATLPDLRAAKGSVLVTNGGLGFDKPELHQIGVQWGVMGLSVANAAKRKLVALLALKLAPDVYVGEVTVTGTVKGTAFDSGQATLDPADIADKFWTLHAGRAESTLVV
jgi:NAD(P)-dependent dehydrogenase (short-subunit alcohol dehydrogenase family)